ncbi:MAG: succinylglutamate desuccinylase/aspartoacylase family protein [Saprospiraceae bacterium]|nr:succinylglutamate desuccinylase/aspartoacylase family protein [Saprospiraceae bacterium]
MKRNRIIGRYSQGLDGPLLVVIGAMHGNEPAGVLALEKVFVMLAEEKVKKPHFEFKGTLLGLIGNLRAFELGKRFIDKDLNRSWSYEMFKEISQQPEDQLNAEQQQIIEIIGVLRDEIEKHPPHQIIVLDLHTTSAHGGIFSLTTDDPISIRMAVELHAPVIKGMLESIQGSSIHFFDGKNMGIPTTAIAFESGQHEDPDSALRAVAAIINCMRTIGCVSANDVENKHDDILINFSKTLPKVSRLIGKYSIRNQGAYKMVPGFKSFDPVSKGQLLAHDGNDAVYCPADGRILMPFYQQLGEDGFFLIEEAGLDNTLRLAAIN